MKLVKKFLILVVVFVTVVVLSGCKPTEEKRYSLFNLAAGFYSDYDPYWSWHSSLAGTANNPTGVKDDELDGIMEKMQKLAPEQTAEFSTEFVKFVQRWNYLMPNLPLYSNEYFDIFNTRISGLKSTPQWGWSLDIADIKIENGENTLTVGTPEITGDFISGFGNSSYDVWVRNLIHGYGTLAETEEAKFEWDTASVLVAEPTTTTDSEGNKTYTFELQDGLKWNTGDAITAKDYVAYILLRSSRDWKDTGATSALAGYYLQGYELYTQGASTGNDENGNPKYDPAYTVEGKSFKGVKLLSDTKFSLTIDKQHLPYFYETTMVSALPIDVETYLPGFDVVNSAEGAKIVKTTATKSLGEVLQTTVSPKEGKVATAQRHFPSVTSGPYKFVSFENQAVRVEKNPHFKGNYEGKVPTIDTVIMKYINQDTNVDEVIAGTVDLVNGVIEGEKIENAKKATTADSVSYPRAGYGYLAMITYAGPTKHVEVRQAISYLFNREQFADTFLGGYGSVVDGPFGESQWFYQENKTVLDATLTHYVEDINKANELLDASPYKFEKDGKTPFDPAKATSTNGYFRYDENKKLLSLNHLGTTNNKVTTMIGQIFNTNAWKVGIDYHVDEAGFDVLLDHYYYGINKWKAGE